MKKNGLAPKRVAKWKIYTALIALITVGMIIFEAGTMYVSYPTPKHREVAQSITRLDQSAFGGGNANPEAVFESDEYKNLQSSTENTYSTRMGVGSGVLSVVLSIAVIVAVYRYLRRNIITRRPIGATIFINVLASILSTAVVFVVAKWFLDSVVESPVILMSLVFALPFAIGFGILATFLVAKAAEWHYNRSHGFMEE